MSHMYIRVYISHTVLIYRGPITLAHQHFSRLCMPLYNIGVHVRLVYWNQATINLLCIHAAL